MANFAVRYPALANRLIEARTARDLTQSALARALDIRQQSVSRWEAGTHRPSIDQVPALAGALAMDAAEIMRLAEFASTPALAIAPLLPLNMLSPDMFERFIADLGAYLFPGSDVRVQGSRGHDQAGWDILIRTDTKTVGVQCKQVERFGPSEVRRAIAAVKKPVDQNILALSRVASPAAAEVIYSDKNWQLWDQDDISRKVRQLPGEQQDRLIDIFFRGQRLALLGRTNAGPWIKPDRFFAPFDQLGGAFTHRWHVVGRDEEMARLRTALEADQPVAIVSGPGGIGKSRIIKEVVEDFAGTHPATLVRFLSPVGDPTRADLEGLGTGSKLLVVDDAHDRDGLPLLIEYVADPDNNARLLFATRPYAEQRIRNDLARFAIFAPLEIRLAALSRPAMRALIGEALKSFGGEAALTDTVMHTAGDNPLVAVMAARVIAEQELSPELARTDAGLRKVVLEKFTHVVTGRIGEPEDSRLVRHVLGLIAMLQPVRIDDREIGELLEAVTPHSAGDASHALRLLIDGGILYKRGQLYRLMPDLLGDYLIDELCIQTNDKLTLFAERVLQTVDTRLLTNVMVNLGRLDWRRQGGDPSESRLLDVAWARFRDIDYDWDPRIDAVRAVAIYQPDQALRFVRERLASGKGFHEASTILRNVAYTPNYRDEALRLLWELGRDDSRDTGPHPSHPIRVLAELCEIDEHKPREFSEEVATFAFGLMENDSEWNYDHSPLAIVVPLLKGTIDRTSSTGRSVTLSSAFVRYDFIKSLRGAVIQRILRFMSHCNPRIAATTARHLRSALDWPRGIGSASPPADLRKRYDREFIATLKSVRAMVVEGKLAPATLLAVADSISWHADYGKGDVGKAAESFLAELPTSLEFRLRAAMVDEARHAFRGQVDLDEWPSDLDRWLEGLADEISSAWPEPEALLDQVQLAILDLHAAGISDGSAYMLVNRLVDENIDLAHLLLARATGDPGSPLRSFVWAAIAQVLNLQPSVGRRLIATYFDRDPDMAARAVPALGTLKRTIDDEDLSLIRQAIGSDHLGVARAALSSLRWHERLPDGVIKALILEAPFDRHPELFGNVTLLLTERRRGLKNLLNADDMSAILARMRNLKSFEGHWSESFLRFIATEFPEQLADFLFDRTDRALVDGESDIELLGYAYHDGKLGFDKSPRAASVLDRAWTWMLSHDGSEGYVVYRAAELVAGMFDIDSPLVVEFLDGKLDIAGPVELKWIGKLLRHTHHFFVFEQRRFVERFLNRCSAAGTDVLELGRDNLTAAAASGMKSGTPGEPMPRDLKAREMAQAVMADLRRLSPAYSLYDEILRDAEADIARAIQEGRALDEEEAA